MESDETKGRQLLEEARQSEASILQKSPEDPGALYRLAAIEASLRERDRAMDHLKKAVHAGCIEYRSLRVDPRFDSLQSERQFSELLDQMTAKVTVLREHMPAELVQSTNNEQHE